MPSVVGVLCSSSIKKDRCIVGGSLIEQEPSGDPSRAILPVS